MTPFLEIFRSLVFQTKKSLQERFVKNQSEIQVPLVIVGLSGGPDSVFLLYLLKELVSDKTIRLVAAHLDHGWRKNSANDVSWCAALCSSLGIQFYAEHAQNLERPKDFGSLEALGRFYRRSFFKRLHEELGAQLVALGHHADDQQETFFVRLIRGSSLSGLCGMRVYSDIYFRPLLDLSKSFILDYLADQNISYLIDETNKSVSFLRNRIRKHVIPALQSCDNRFDKKIATTVHYLQEEDDFLQALTSKEFDGVFECNRETGIARGNLNLFRELHVVLQKRLLIFWFIHERVPFEPQNCFLAEILRFLLSSRGGFHGVNQSWGIKKQGQFFWINQHAD